MKLTIQVEKFLQSIFYLSFNLMTLMHVNMRLILTNIIDHTFSKRLIFKTLSNQMEIVYFAIAISNYYMHRIMKQSPNISVSTT